MSAPPTKAPPKGALTLVLGGTSSGKSAVAEALVARLPEPVTYLATMEVGGDDDLAARVAAHRARRPASWATLEVGAELVEVLSPLRGTVLLDSLGPWVAAGERHRGDVVDDLCATLRARAGDTVVVSDEVGLGVHPSTELGRRFRDQMGEVNQAVASVADEVLLVVAGMVLPLRPLGQR